MNEKLDTSFELIFRGLDLLNFAAGRPDGVEH
jgi:hypothetical protein